MATDEDFVLFASDQMSDAGTITYRKMFGEYAVYCDGKVVALICDNKLFVKQTEAGREYIGNIIEAPAYEGAKPSFLIEEQLEDREWISSLIRITAAELPEPKQKKRKKKRNPDPHNVLLLFLVLFTIFPACHIGLKNREPASLSILTTSINRQIPRLMKLYRIPGVSVALLHRGRIVFLEGYGVADRDSSAAVTPDTLFQAGSISKSLTAWGIMLLVEESLIDLDVPADQYLQRWHFPASEFDSEDVTVRRLLSHTAGLPRCIFEDPGPGKSAPTLPEILSGHTGPGAAGRLSPARITAEPGAYFTYSNPGYTVLELLVEDITGTAFEIFMQKSVLDPLGMTDSSFIHRDGWKERLATGYRYDGSPVPVNKISVKAAGGLRTSARELARFAAAGMPNESARGLLKSDSLKVLHSPETGMNGLLYRAAADSYALGHFIETSPTGPRIISHGGENEGWISHYCIVPETGDGIVLLTNSERSHRLISAVIGRWGRLTGLGIPEMSRTISLASWIMGTLTMLLGAASLLCFLMAAVRVFPILRFLFSIKARREAKLAPREHQRPGIRSALLPLTGTAAGILAGYFTSRLQLLVFFPLLDAFLPPVCFSLAAGLLLLLITSRGDWKTGEKD